MSETNSDRDGGEPPRQVGIVEWAVAALGAALVAGVLATLTYEALTYREGPPSIAVKVDHVDRTESGHVVRFTARNEGPTTAAEVTILGRLTDAGQVVEEAQITLDYVARQSAREAGLIFERDPATATLELRATSYRKP